MLRVGGASEPVRVAIIDDYDIVVAGVAALLEPFEAVEVVELDTNLPALTPVDVVLYDSFAQAQGPEIDTGSLTVSHPAKVVVFSWNISVDLVQRSLAAGVHGYVSKGVDGAFLANALVRVHRGELVTPQSPPQSPGDQAGAWPGKDLGLSARESEVLALICQGLSNQDITERAFIGINTVKTHIRTLYRKIGVDSRSRAVLWGVDHGFAPDRTRVLEG